jgi:alpha-glucosidase
MCSNFTDNGIRLAANIKPFLLETHPLFASAAAAGVLVTDGSATKQPFRSTFWAGGAFSVGYGAFIDFSSEAGFDFWVEQLRTNVLAYGIQVPWNDNNEFRMHDDAVLAGFGAPLRASLARPLQTLLMAMASRDACLRARPGQRPYVLTRSACVGVQRHCQSWSGDNMTSFHTLLHNLPMGTGMALSGLGNTGHDVGGFYGPLPGRELWLRWIASQVFMPRFTIHSFNTDGTVTSPWCHEDAIGDVRHMLRFRRRLRPTLYSAMWRSSRDGTPPIRPLVFDFAADERCRTESSLYMLGDSILVVSAVREGATSVDVTLPATSRWCEWHSGEWFDGGAHLKLPAPLGRCLFFVRAGGAVALCDGANDAAVRVVLAVPPAPSDGSDAQSLWPDEQARATSLIFDDGESLAYRDGAFAQLDVSAVRDGNAVAVRVTVVHDGFARPQSVPVALLGADDEVHLAAGGLRQLEAGDDDNSAHVPKRLVWFDVPVHK